MKHLSGQSKLRILIVDDHPLMRQALRQIIEQEEDMIVCGEAEDVEDALMVMALSFPHLAVVDLSLRSSDGLELVKHICRKYPNVLTLVLSMHDESFHAERAIRAGANGYISKQAPPNLIMDAMRKIQRGEIYWPEKGAAEAVKRLARRAGPQKQDGDPMVLSDRELEVFRLIGTGSNPAEIAALMKIAVCTVDTYRSRIKAKLGLKRAADLRREAVRWNIEKNGQSGLFPDRASGK